MSWLTHSSATAAVFSCPSPYPLSVRLGSHARMQAASRLVSSAHNGPTQGSAGGSQNDCDEETEDQKEHHEELEAVGRLEPVEDRNDLWIIGARGCLIDRLKQCFPDFGSLVHQ